MGTQCYHVTHLRSPEPVSLGPSQGDVCDRCRKEGYSPEEVSEEYVELFRAVRVLFEEGVTDEMVIIPTLAFAACSWEIQVLRHIRDEFLKTGEGSEARKELENEFINTFGTLGVECVVDGTLLVRSRPLVALIHVDDTTSLAERITIDVYPHSLDEVKSKEVAEHYEWALRRHGIAQDWRGSSVSHSVLPTRVRIMAEPKNPQIDLLGVHMLWPPPKEQPAFPHAREIQAKYEVIVHAAKESGSTHPFAGRQKGQSFKAHNLIPACVAWYVGNRGQFIGESGLEAEVKKILKRHLEEPFAMYIPTKTKSTLRRDIETASEHISRVDGVLREREIYEYSVNINF
jgi:hypothetical protein